MKPFQSFFKLLRTLPCPATKLVLIVRNDLKMSKGKTAAQCAHAAVLCVLKTQNSGNRLLLECWLAKGQPKIVLKVDGGYNDLVKLREEAKKNNVICELVQDAGHTQLAAGTATVLGIGPDSADKIDKLVGHLKLL